MPHLVHPNKLGSIGHKLAAAIAGFVLVDKFASYCTGREDLKERSSSQSANFSESIAEYRWLVVALTFATRRLG
jgi:hypothetical protein